MNEAATNNTSGCGNNQSKYLEHPNKIPHSSFVDISHLLPVCLQRLQPAM
jgi:hypothetical protein